MVINALSCVTNVPIEWCKNEISPRAGAPPYFGKVLIKSIDRQKHNHMITIWSLHLYVSSYHNYCDSFVLSVCR